MALAIINIMVIKMDNVCDKEEFKAYDEKKKECLEIYVNVKNILSKAQSMVWVIEEAVADASDVVDAYYVKNNINIDILDKNEAIYEYIEKFILLRNEISNIYRMINGLDIFYHGVDNEEQYGFIKYESVANDKINIDKKVVENAMNTLQSIYSRLVDLLDAY